MEDSHGDSGGRVEGFAHQQQLFGGREGGRERRQLLQRDVGRQSGVQGEHGRYDAVGQQTFRLNARNKEKNKYLMHLHQVVSLR